MTRLSLLGVAAVAAFAAFSAPAYAQHRATHQVNAATEGAWCANRVPGNPYNKETDFHSWSAWMDRGGWDDHNDFKCAPSRINYGSF